MTIFFRRFVHYAVYVVGGIVILLSLIALAVRFLIMPEIGRYRPEIEASASKAVGMPVKIQALHADWVRFNPHITLENVSLAPPGQPEPLHIAKVEATVSWLSLVWLEPHLAALDIYRPVLDVKRERNGAIYVAGIPVNTGGPPSPFPDWLLSQRTVTISNGKVTWIDDKLGAPPLVLDRLDFGLDNHFSHHRFGLTARPPAEAATNLDIRGDLHGGALENFNSWHGQIYLRADRASATAINTWSPWAQSAVQRSVGDVRFWLDFDHSQIVRVNGDVNLANVAFSWGKDLPDMVFSRISGHLGWSQKDRQQTFTVKSLRFATANGQMAEPSDFKLIFTPTATGKIESAQVEADNVRIEAVTALSGALPLPRQVHDWLADFNPHGFLEHANVDWLGKDHFHLAARFRDAGMNATRRLPGFSGLSGDIEADDSKGHVKLDSQGLRLVYDPVFRQPLDLNRFSAEAQWTGSPKAGYRVELNQCEIGNADLDATAQGNLALPPGKSPVIDLKARLTRAKGNAVWRYLPHQVDDEAYAWLKQSIVDGTSPDTRLTLQGPLDRFPFDKGGGQFQVKVRIKDGVLAYAPDWPHITGIDGWLTFQGKNMTLSAERGDILGVRLTSVHAAIPDLWQHDKYLELNGQATGPMANFLEFIRQSPINEHIGHFTEDMKATGKGSLNLALHMPLNAVSDTLVNGRIRFANNDITLDDRLPPLTQVTGALGFTDTSVKGAGIHARLFDQPMVIALNSEHGGRIHARASGNLDAATLAKWVPAPLSGRITGSTPIEANITVKQHVADLKLESSLAGLAIDLPAPIGKKAASATPFSLDVQKLGDPHPAITFAYGDVLTGNLQTQDNGPERISLMLGGKAAPPPTADGITVGGSLHSLDLDVWRHLDLGQANGSSLAIHDINLSLNELQVFDRQFQDINLQAHPEQKGWMLKLNGREAVGEVHYQSKADSAGGSLSGRFKTLVLPPPIAGSEGSGPVDAADFPHKIDLAIQSFTYDKQKLGNLNLQLTSAKEGFAIETCSLDAPDGHLDANGWLSTSALGHTRLDVNLKSGNLGDLMGRLGYAKAVKGGELSVQGKLDWRGNPESFQLDRLGGSLAVDLKSGRFLQLDPGAGKLLGILSLQALPRRITLDFRDIFSEGFAFDHIQGKVILDRGVGYLPDLSIKGPAANIRMTGQIDLVHQNQELRLHIQPRLDEGVAVGAALLGGPVVGVGALVAAKILKDPFSQAASFEYLVRGSWEDPVVVKLGKPAPASPPGKP